MGIFAIQEDYVSLNFRKATNPDFSRIAVQRYDIQPVTSYWDLLSGNDLVTYLWPDAGPLR